MYPTKLCMKCRMELFFPAILFNKEVMVMDSLKNMNAAMQYIEDNLTHEIDFKEVAK